MAEDVIQLDGLQHAYRRAVALHGVSLTVRSGEIVAVTGPSGCGKSTLLHLASGVQPVQTGAAVLLGRDLRALGEADRSRLRRHEVGIVLQFGQLVPDLAVLDNVALPLLMDGQPRAAAHTAARYWLDRVGLTADGSTVPAELSGGEAQRAAVARALITEPKVVFADEPTGSMDVRGGELLLDLLVGHAREHGATLVLVTHDNAVAAHADREIRLRDGAVAHQGSLL